MRGEAILVVKANSSLLRRAPFYGRGAVAGLPPNKEKPHGHPVTAAGHYDLDAHNKDARRHPVTRSGHCRIDTRSQNATPHLSTSAGHSAFDTHDQRARAHPSTDSGQTRNADHASVARIHPFTSRAMPRMQPSKSLPDSPLRRAASMSLKPNNAVPLGPLFPVRPAPPCNPSGMCCTTYSGDSPC